MAYETIGSYKVYEFIQEEAFDDSGNLTAQYCHLWVDFVVKQKLGSNSSKYTNNRNYFRAELVANVALNDKGNEFTVQYSLSQNSPNQSYIRLGSSFYGNDQSDAHTGLYARLNQTSSTVIYVWDSTDVVNDKEDGEERNLIFYSDLDGRFTHYINADATTPRPLELVFDGRCAGYCWTNKGGYSGFITPGSSMVKEFDGNFSDIRPIPLNNDRNVYPTTANNFTDEESPSFSYATPITGYSFYSADSAERGADSISSLQAGLSLDGETIDITYRSIPTTGGTYTFVLTEAERELLRQKAQGSNVVPIYYMLRVVRKIDTNMIAFVSKTQRLLTIVGCEPQLNPTVKDIQLETLALTGDENTMVRYESMAEFSTGAVASKHATIVSQSVQCGSKTISDLFNGIIDDVETGIFVFNATDSRKLSAEPVVIEKNLIEYVKPTCYQKVVPKLSGEVDAQVILTITGNYYDGSFGAVDNELTLEVRYTQDDGKTFGDWIVLTNNATPVFNNDTYELEATIGGFKYDKAYIFQCRATDKLNRVASTQYTVRVIPIFDWGEYDFNFNVPVNINAETLDMNNNTIIRHSKEADNVVLSAPGGHIYLRPNGTDNTENELKITSDGKIIIGEQELSDFVIETGTTEMGTNGVWYWRKWASGRAECIGQRNFGIMAITTAWGGLYRSAVLTQALPADLFAQTPEVINITLESSNFGGWIVKHETSNPSDSATGSFIVVRPASATLSTSYVSFNVIGRWK